jgi:hypothetical protein
MKKQITLLLCFLTIFGIAKAQTPDPGTWESLENLNKVTQYPNSKNANSTANLVGLSQVYSSTGKYTISVDGKGATGTSMTIRVNKPNATATVQKAILMSTVTGGTIANGCVTLSGVGVNWNGSATSGGAFNFNNYWADVTSIVAAQINSFPAGISNLNITECNTARIEGEALLVVFNDAETTEKTIIIMFGAAAPTGDNFSVTLAQPIDPSAPGALLDMGLGIGFSYQTGGGSQISQVSVNGQRLSSSAGGEDDGASANGALISVGGIGDVNTNPANPNTGPTNPRTDDELYNILPFITNTTTSLNITTFNPSNNDNIFLAYFALSGAAIIGEGILLSQTATSGNVGTTHTVNAVVKNTLGQPIPNKLITFNITSGPNSGLSPFSTTTDVNGEAYFTYTGNGGIGIDNIEACFTNSQNVLTCSNVLSFQWIAPPQPPTITCTADITVNNASGQCGANVSYPAATTTGTPTPTITYSHASGSFFPVGITTVTATATNINGTASCTFTVTVVDNQPPTIICAAAQTQTADPGLCTAAVTVTGPTLGIPAVAIGQTFQGGKVAYILQPGDPGYVPGEQRGLIAAPFDQGLLTWGCFNTLIPGADGIGLGTGNQNTIDIMAACGTAGIAARICGDLVLNGYDDWYLPSLTELNMLQANRIVIGGFSTNAYWSSSEASIVGAWQRHFSAGQGPYDKFQALNVRAVRSFSNIPTPGDNCGTVSLINSFNGTSNASGTYPVGTTTVTWTATDANNNTATCTQVVTVVDNQAPVITCPANVTRQCGTSTDPSATGYATATDNCGATTVSYSDQSTAGSFLYLQTWESGTGGWFSKLGAGDPVVLVSDPTAPSPSTVHKITTCQSGGHYYSPLIPVVPGQTYCFSLWIRWEGGCWPFLGIDRYNAAGTNLGENWLIGQPGYPDGFGGTVTPVPATASGWNLYFKTITIPAGVTQVRLKNEMFVGASKGGATLGFFDNIGFTNGSCTTSPGFCSQNYQILRTWTATDGSGNSSSCLQTITVVDNTPPAITCPANISVQCGTSTAPAATGSATATDNCSTPVIGYSDVRALTGCSGTGTITRTWKATDECGNSSTCVQTITVIDTQAPQLTGTIPSGQTGLNLCFNAIPSGPTEAAIAALYTDNCGTVHVTKTGTPTGDNCSWSVTYHYVIKDDCDNEATAVDITYSGGDTEAPTLAGSIPAGGTNLNVCFTNIPSGPTEAAIAALYTDNCGTVHVTKTGTPTGDNCSWSVTYHYVIKDDCDNEATAVDITYSGGDTEKPTFTRPSDITLYKGAECTVDDSPSGDAGDVTDEADNCSTNMNATYTDVIVDNCEGTYTITRTWHLVDNCNNHAADQVQTITVKDNTNPVITCPANITVVNTTGQCGANVSFAATGTDNCGTPVITYSHNPGSYFAVGTTIVTATATDACNNTSQCTFSIIVNDNENPVINVSNIARCYADDNFGCNISLGATATDNCGVLSLTSDAPGCFPVGITTVTWTATDIHGNVTTATQLVTRNPEININICAGPTRTIYRGTTSGVGPFGPQSVNLTSTVTGGTPGYTYNWTPSTGLSNASIANPVASPAVTTTYTLKVTDSKGCSRTLSITINVLPLSSAVCSGSGNNIKFSVCHIPPGNPSNPQNICISVNALNAHLTSGSNGHNNCYLGPCQQNCFSTIPGAASLITRTQTVQEEVIVEEAPIVEVNQPDFKVIVYPNPSAYDFSLLVLSKSNELITVRILDLNGKVSSVQTQLSKANSIKVGSMLIGGTYFAEVTQGSNRQVVKLVKLN